MVQLEFVATLIKLQVCSSYGKNVFNEQIRKKILFSLLIYIYIFGKKFRLYKLLFLLYLCFQLCTDYNDIVGRAGQ